MVMAMVMAALIFREMLIALKQSWALGRPESVMGQHSEVLFRRRRRELSTPRPDRLAHRLSALEKSSR
jgi:hypothetical protein